MDTYEIKITNTSDASELHTFEVTAEDLATLADILERTASYSDELELDMEDGEVIEISQHSEHGYNANAYENREAFDRGDDPIGGGLCTGTLSDAIEMALTSR